MVQFLGVILENTLGFWIGALMFFPAGLLIMYFFKEKVDELMGWGE